MIRFDTRDKKPKLYDLLPLTAVAAVLLGAPAHRVKQALILGGLAVFYVGLTMLAYLKA